MVARRTDVLRYLAEEYKAESCVTIGLILDIVATEEAREVAGRVEDPEWGETRSLLDDAVRRVLRTTFGEEPSAELRAELEEARAQLNKRIDEGVAVQEQMRQADARESDLRHVLDALKAKLDEQARTIDKLNGNHAPAGA